MGKQKYSLSEADDTSSHTEMDSSQVPWWTSSRLGLAVLGFFGFLNVYALRVNMSVAIVCMVNDTAVGDAAVNNTDNNTDIGSVNLTTPSPSSCALVKSGRGFEDGEFVWSKSVQGIILGSFFWGYLLTQIPGGWLATKIGGKRVFGYCMLGATIATVLTPVAAQWHYTVLIVLRVIVGITSGVCYPSMHAIWGNWAPPTERSKLVSFTYAGAQVGNVVTFPLAGLLCKYGFAGGWPSIFYILGILSFVWFVLWMFLVSDSPSQHKRISKAEQKYIEHALKDSVKSGEKDRKVDVPWTKMATSMPVIAILVGNITSDWGTYTLLTNIPTYMKEVLKLDISSNGLYSALPYVAFWAVINIAGLVADLIVSKKCCSITFTRKSFTICGMVIPAVLLVTLGYIDCTQPSLAITLLVFAVSITGVQYSGWLVNHMDIAPAYAGILFGISNSIAAVTGFLSPTVVGLITENKTREEWQMVFFISAGFYVFGSVFYGLFGSGEIQPWAREKQTDTGERQQLNDTEMQDLTQRTENHVTA